MKLIKIGSSILSVMLIAVGLFMIINGSLEAFPTPEQIEKTRIGGIVLVVIGACVESIILIILYKTKKKDK